jgi:hypothetical protein
MNKTAYSHESRWEKLYNELLARVQSKGKKFPTEDEFDALVNITQKAFGNTSFYDYYVDKNIDLRNRWLKCKKQRDREKNQQKKLRGMEMEIILTPEKSSTVFSIINKIASENNIKSSEIVSIQLDRDSGVIKFNGVE